jgi:hypothetical protein
MLDVLEVVNSPAESQKCVAHETNKSQKLLLKTGQTGYSGLANQMVRFHRVCAAIRDTIGSGEGVLLPAKWHLTKGRNDNHDNSRSCGGGYRI